MLGSPGSHGLAGTRPAISQKPPLTARDAARGGCEGTAANLYCLANFKRKAFEICKAVRIRRSPLKASPCRAPHDKGRWHLRSKCRRGCVADIRVPRNLKRSNPLSQLRCQLPLCPRGALGAPAPVLHGKKSFKCYSLVGADDSVGPLGSYGFAAVFRKIGASRRGDVGIDPYNWRSA